MCQGWGTLLVYTTACMMKRSDLRNVVVNNSYRCSFRAGYLVTVFWCLVVVEFVVNVVGFRRYKNEKKRIVFAQGCRAPAPLCRLMRGFY